MTTTIIELPDPIHRSAERRAALENIPLEELMVGLLVSALDGKEPDTAAEFQEWRAELL